MNDVDDDDGVLDAEDDHSLDSCSLDVGVLTARFQDGCLRF